LYPAARAEVPLVGVWMSARLVLYTPIQDV
jgi:hypothetical protein